MRAREDKLLGEVCLTANVAAVSRRGDGQTDLIVQLHAAERFPTPDRLILFLPHQSNPNSPHPARGWIEEDMEGFGQISRAETPPAPTTTPHLANALSES